MGLADIQAEYDAVADTDNTVEDTETSDAQIMLDKINSLDATKKAEAIKELNTQLLDASKFNLKEGLDAIDPIVPPATKRSGSIDDKDLNYFVGGKEKEGYLLMLFCAVNGGTTNFDKYGFTNAGVQIGPKFKADYRLALKNAGMLEGEDPDDPVVVDDPVDVVEKDEYEAGWIEDEMRDVISGIEGTVVNDDRRDGAVTGAKVGAGTGAVSGGVAGTIVAGPVGTGIGAVAGAGYGAVAGTVIGGVGDALDENAQDFKTERDVSIEGKNYLVDMQKKELTLNTFGYETKDCDDVSLKNNCATYNWENGTLGVKLPGIGEYTYPGTFSKLVLDAEGYPDSQNNTNKRIIRQMTWFVNMLNRMKKEYVSAEKGSDHEHEEIQRDTSNGLQVDNGTFIQGGDTDIMSLDAFQTNMTVDKWDDDKGDKLAVLLNRMKVDTGMLTKADISDDWMPDNA